MSNPAQARLEGAWPYRLRAVFRLSDSLMLIYTIETPAGVVKTVQLIGYN